MKEKSLSDAIDLLAARKAREFVNEVKAAIDTALKNKWHAKLAHTSSEYLGVDIRNVLLAYAHYIETGTTYKTPQPTTNLVNICRVNILDDLLDGIPRLKELALLQAEEVCKQCGTSPCHCDIAELN